eukprot:1371784-Rhodomonas_salina.2
MSDTDLVHRSTRLPAEASEHCRCRFHRRGRCFSALLSATGLVEANGLGRTSFAISWCVDGSCVVWFGRRGLRCDIGGKWGQVQFVKPTESGRRRSELTRVRVVAG